MRTCHIDPSISVTCGTSGIDGSTSTAIGAAVASKIPTVLITGDIGFLYDSNALWNQYIPKNFKIILINNGGGGIFRILPGHEENAVFNTFLRLRIVSQPSTGQDVRVGIPDGEQRAYAQHGFKETLQTKRKARPA
jgi:hypothetical protein